MKLRDLLPIAAVLATAYFAIFGGEYGLFEVWRIERQAEAEAAELIEFRAEVDLLRLRADSLANDSAALERIARERYGMIRDGERLYRFVGGDADSAPAAPEDAR